MTNDFIWYELLTSDPDAASAFYGEVLGWTVDDSGQAGMDYRILSMQGVGVGGLMKIPSDGAELGMQPCWLGYISVPDVDASVASIVAAGGAEHMPAMDLPGVGRVAMMADPQGAPFYVMTAIGEGPATSFAPGKPGHGGWHELHTDDWQAAFAFYSAQFGWTKVDEMDMGPAGTYALFNCGSGDALGGMFNSADAPRPNWLYYFNVADIDAASQRVVANGGKTLTAPHQVPGGDWVVRALDPQSASFALVGPKRQAEE